MLKTSTGTQSLYVYTGQGSPVALLRDFGGTGYTYKYDPYGVATLTSDSGGTGKPQNPFLFAGGIQDRATGWVKFGARWYNPTLGRWTQQDTLDTPLDPANANRYTYAANDPINVLDPSGRRGDLGTNLAIGAGVGLVAGALIGCAIGAVGGGVAGAILGLGAGAVPGGLAGCLAVAQPLGFAGTVIGTISGFVYSALPE